MRTPPADALEVARFLDLLDDDEQAQAAKFKLAPDRAAYITAHALLRTTLAVLAGGSPRLLRFAPDAQGRPQIIPANPIRFSLAHCRRFVACVVCRDFDVGIDIEDLSRPEVQWRDSMVFLPDQERAYIEAGDAEGRRDRFFRLWTMREAFAKASGMGLARALETVEFDLDPYVVRLADGSISAGNEWQFECLSISGEFALAVAALAPGRVKITVIDQPV